MSEPYRVVPTLRLQASKLTRVCSDVHTVQASFLETPLSRH